MRCLLSSAISFLLCFQALPALALPGEAAAVIRHCGTPNAENIANSEVTNRLQRDLTYGNAMLHFVPDGGGWSFTSAWRGHLPVTRSGLEASLPCFRDALAEAATQPLAPIDPTIAQATVVRTSGFGVPNLGWIVLLGIFLIAVMLWPRRPKSVVSDLPAARRSRRPTIPGYLLRRKSRRATTV